MNQKPTVEETQDAYLKTYGDACSTDEAVAILHDFLRYRDWMDKIKISEEAEYIADMVDPDTIELFIQSRRDREIEKKDHDEYTKMVSEMEPSQRWLYEEGLDDGFGKWVQHFLDSSKEGQELVESVSSIWTDAYPHQLKKVVEKLFDYAKENPPPEVKRIPDSIDEFLTTEEANHLVGWFVGICNDGGRACRTIHHCARAFSLHKWDTFKIWKANPEVKEAVERFGEQ